MPRVASAALWRRHCDKKPKPSADSQGSEQMTRLWTKLQMPAAPCRHLDCSWGEIWSQDHPASCSLENHLREGMVFQGATLCLCVGGNLLCSSRQQIHTHSRSFPGTGAGHRCVSNLPRYPSVRTTALRPGCACVSVCVLVHLGVCPCCVHVVGGGSVSRTFARTCKYSVGVCPRSPGQSLAQEGLEQGKEP